MNKDNNNYTDIVVEIVIFSFFLACTIGLMNVNIDSVLLKVLVGFFIGMDAVTSINVVRKVIENIIESKKKNKQEETKEIYKKELVKEYQKEEEKVNVISYNITNEKAKEKAKQLILKK